MRIQDLLNSQDGELHQPSPSQSSQSLACPWGATNSPLQSYTITAFQDVSSRSSASGSGTTGRLSASLTPSSDSRETGSADQPQVSPLPASSSPPGRPTQALVQIDKLSESDLKLTCTVDSDRIPGWVGDWAKRQSPPYPHEDFIRLKWKWNEVPTWLMNSERIQALAKPRARKSMTVSLCLPKSFLQDSINNSESYRVVEKMILRKCHAGLPDQCISVNVQERWFDPDKFEAVKASLAARMIELAHETYNASFPAAEASAEEASDAERGQSAEQLIEQERP
ncbi:hypothetical protein NCC49_001941 [Naganishia albida]|nr:hypothetical protein NCC49_001941 [Naganishia albida]